MKLTKQERNFLYSFDWILRARVKHNRLSINKSIGDVDEFAYQELKFILEEWRKLKINLKLRLK